MNYKEAALNFLTTHTVGVLSTLSDTNQLWGAAIYYVVDEQFQFYFLTHAETRKYQNMQHTSQAALTIVDDVEQSSVQAHGMVSEVPLGDEYNIAFSKLAGVHPPGEHRWVPPVSKMEKSHTTLLKFTPDQLRYANFKAQASTSGELIHSIL